MNTETSLRNFYDYSGEMFAVVRADGIFLVQGPEDQERLTGDAARETQLCVFTDVEQASRYMELCPAEDSYVIQISLERLWTMLERINSLSMVMFKLPVRIDVAILRGDKLVVVDTLHSTFMASC